MNLKQSNIYKYGGKLFTSIIILGIMTIVSNYLFSGLNEKSDVLVFMSSLGLLVLVVLGLSMFYLTWLKEFDYILGRDTTEKNTKEEKV